MDKKYEICYFYYIFLFILVLYLNENDRNSLLRQKGGKDGDKYQRNVRRSSFRAGKYKETGKNHY